MNLEYICEQMVRILHGNITCISESGAIEACYGDMAAQCNPLFTDPEFLSAVHERERKDYPDLFYEKDKRVNPCQLLLFNYPCIW